MSLRPSHFWLRLYQLAEAFEERGATQAERTTVIKAELSGMPPEVREQSLRRLKQLGQTGAAIAAEYEAASTKPT
jgi:hypothetical protein